MPLPRRQVSTQITFELVLTFATEQKFYVVVNLVKKHSVEELVETLRTRVNITAEQVIRESKGPLIVKSCMDWIAYSF